MAKLPIIYTVRLDITPEARDEFEAWASTKHIDDLLAAGFLSATRFKASKGSPEYLHLYRAAQPGAAANGEVPERRQERCHHWQAEQ